MTDFVSQIGVYCSKLCCDLDKVVDAAARFWPNVDKSGECWLWTGRVSPGGYGKFWFNGKSARAHRVALELSGVWVENAAIVCHHCDNPRCVRPDHLFIGTNKDNTADMWRKGRARPKARIRASRPCDICGEAITGTPARIAERKYCSHRCAANGRWSA